MLQRLMMFVLLSMFARRCSADAEDARVRGLIQNWAPLVWLAPGERFLPLGVPEFLENMEADENYLRTRLSIQTLLQNRSSFLHGKTPTGDVPIYALVKNCLAKSLAEDGAKKGGQEVVGERPGANLLVDEFLLSPIETNNVPGSFESSEISLDPSSLKNRRLSRSRPALDASPVIQASSHLKLYQPDESKRRKLKLQSTPLFRPKKQAQAPLHFHVTYWMFYPFSDGKAVCVLDLGFLGSWPIPSFGGMCLGKLKEYGSHVGDWEHVSLYFKGKDYPIAMYVSAHDAGAFYRYEPRTNTFIFESQETRKGIFQKPIFPERVHTSDGSHPILFSARGSHGLWTAPGKHKFVRLPRLYDESGFGTAWPTWQNVQVLPVNEKSVMPAWMTFTGKWGNPKSNCHPLAKLGFNICEFVDGPTGIPMKKMNFNC